MPAEKGLEYAVFLPDQGVTINDTIFDAGDFIEFDRESGIPFRQTAQSPLTFVAITPAPLYADALFLGTNL
ncbi:hypothetical protein GCM10009415_46450 [Chitinophaga japonensis]